MPCSEKRARLLFERGQARVHRRLPFTIRLVAGTVTQSAVPRVIKPGSQQFPFRRPPPLTVPDAHYGAIWLPPHRTFGRGGQWRQEKWNRYRLQVPKIHGLDALGVGHVEVIEKRSQPLLKLKVTGHGS